MSDINNVIVTGRITHDAELRYTNNGSAVTEFSVACNRFYYSKKTESTEKDTVFIDCTLWGRPAENLVDYLRKGQLVGIEGRLNVDTWKDKEENSRRKMYVSCVNVNLLGPRPNSEELVHASSSDDVPFE